MPGAAWALIEGGEIVHEGGLGLMAADRGDPVTPATLFQACSISKPVAALAMLRLVDRGVLDLDEDVNDRLTSWRVPPLEAWQPVVTLRQLVSHSAGLTTSGFPGYRVGRRAADDGRGARRRRAGEHLRRAGRHRSRAPVPLLRRWDDGHAAAARGRHRDAAPRARARARAGAARDGRQRLRPALPEELHGRAATAHDEVGRPIEGQVAHLPGARGRRPLDDSRRPRAIRDRRAAHVRGSRRRAALARARAGAADAADRGRRPDGRPPPARSRPVPGRRGSRRAGSVTRAATWASAVSSSPTGRRGRARW